MAEEQNIVEGPESMAEVAKAMYGDKFVGEVAEKEAPEAKEEPAAEEDVEIEASEEVTEEIDATEETEEETAETELAETSEAEEVDITTLGELVDHYDLDADWTKGLKVPVKINGSDSSASIDDLVASYQMGEAAEARLDDAKTKAHAILEDASGRLQNVNNQAKIVASLIERAEAVVDQDVTDIDWKRLRQDDPAEYSAKKADIEERRRTIDGLKTDALGEYQKGLDEHNKEVAGQRANLVRAEQAKLLAKLPDWADPETAAAEQGKISQYLMGQGFSQDDVASAADHRIILLARKAMLYDQGHEKADASKKKVAKIPKVMKPGTPKPQDQRRSEKIEILATKARKTGKIEDAAAYLKAKRTA